MRLSWLIDQNYLRNGYLVANSDQCLIASLFNALSSRLCNTTSVLYLQNEFFCTSSVLLQIVSKIFLKHCFRHLYESCFKAIVCNKKWSPSLDIAIILVVKSSSYFSIFHIQSSPHLIIYFLSRQFLPLSIAYQIDLLILLVKVTWSHPLIWSHFFHIKADLVTFNIAWYIMINELNEVYYLANYLTLYSVQLTWLVDGGWQWQNMQSERETRGGWVRENDREMKRTDEGIYYFGADVDPRS